LLLKNLCSKIHDYSRYTESEEKLTQFGD